MTYFINNQRWPILCLILAILQSCSSYEKIKQQAMVFEVPSQYYEAPVEQVWAAAVEIFNRFQSNQQGEGGIAEQDQERGVIKTQWIDNTDQMNFTDSFSNEERIRSAKIKMILTLEAISKDPKKPKTKVSIYKRQFVENDLFQGWKEYDNDFVLEKALLYRLQRLLWLDREIVMLQEQMEQRKLKELQN